MQVPRKFRFLLLGGSFIPSCVCCIEWSIVHQNPTINNHWYDYFIICQLYIRSLSIIDQKSKTHEDLLYNPLISHMSISPSPQIPNSQQRSPQLAKKQKQCYSVTNLGKTGTLSDKYIIMSNMIQKCMPYMGKSWEPLIWTLKIRVHWWTCQTDLPQLVMLAELSC